MARIRTIKPEFWTDSKTGSLSPIATKLFIGLLNHADDYGVIRWNLEEFKTRIMPYESGTVAETIGKPMAEELLVRGLVVWFSVDTVQYLHITNFEKHQRVDRPGKPFIDGWTVGMSPDSFASKSGIENIELNMKVESFDESSRNFASPREKMPRKGREGRGEENTYVESKSDSTLMLLPQNGNGHAITPIWEYFVEKLGKSSVYEFSEKRKAMGKRCYEWALKRTRDPSKAEDWMKIGIDELSRSDYHMGRGKYQGQTRYCDWENVFKTVDKFQWWLERNNEKCQ